LKKFLTAKKTIPIRLGIEKNFAVPNLKLTKIGRFGKNCVHFVFPFHLACHSPFPGIVVIFLDQVTVSLLDLDQVVVVFQDLDQVVVLLLDQVQVSVIFLDLVVVSLLDLDQVVVIFLDLDQVVLILLDQVVVSLPVLACPSSHGLVNECPTALPSLTFKLMILFLGPLKLLNALSCTNNSHIHHTCLLSPCDAFPCDFLNVLLEKSLLCIHHSRKV
jgi:hypothetical protein